MPKHIGSWVYVAVLVAFALVVWFTLVPGTISTATFAYGAATAAMLLAVVLSIVKHSGPARSIGDVLGDLEDRRKSAR